MKNIFTFSLIAALLLTVSWANASEGVSRELKENIVRLHIIANSNTPEDQSLKLSVRDRLLKEAKNNHRDRYQQCHTQHKYPKPKHVLFSFFSLYHQYVECPMMIPLLFYHVLILIRFFCDGLCAHTYECILTYPGVC